MAVTMQQIAEQAGVSRGTVDRALNKRGRIDPEVAERIEKVAEELGYVHKPRMRRKKIHKNIKIGVVTQLSKAGFMIQIHKGIETAKKELGERGIEVLVKECVSVREDEQLDGIEEILEEGIQGLAIMPVDLERVRAKLNQIINERKNPVITFNSDIVGTGRSCFVGMDNVRSGRVAAGLLGTLTGGEGKILIVTGHFGSLLNNQRVDGFVEEIKKSFPQIEIAGVQGSFDESREVEKIIVNAMRDIPDINGIFVVSSGQEGIERAFSKLCLPKRPYMVVYDQTSKNEKLLEEGMVDFLIDQNGFEQGYRPLRILEDILLGRDDGGKGNLFTEISIKTKYNI